MLSPKLSKILAEKNVPHEGDKWWGEDITHGKFTLLNSNRDSMWVNYIPAYPEIALFKYAKELVGERGQYEPDAQDWDYDADPNPPDDEYFGSPDYQIYIHTLADLFSSGASAEEIEEYVLSSIEKG